MGRVQAGHVQRESDGMKILRFIHLSFAQAFYGWALREINPMHPDLPKIVIRRQELADAARRMFA
jgi:hypothetical protein